MKYTTGVATLFLVAACGCRGEPQRETSPIDSGVIDGSEPAVERWRTMDLTDAFGNSSAYAAQSSAATAVFAMRPPYDRVQAWLMVECDEAWIRFFQTPNLTGGILLGGRLASHRVDVLFDGEPVLPPPDPIIDSFRWDHWSLQMNVGERDLNFDHLDGTDNRRVIELIHSSTTMGIAVNWYQEGKVAFLWSLDGASEAIQWSCERKAGTARSGSNPLTFEPS